MTSREMRCWNSSNAGSITRASASAEAPHRRRRTSSDRPPVGGFGRPHRRFAVKKYVVLYLRYSTDMQRTESCEDQERNIRRDLPRFGVPAQDVLVVRDEAESGTKTSRD